MRFNLIILLYLFTSCTTNYTKIDNRKPYNAKGFAYIYNDEDFANKNIKNPTNMKEITPIVLGFKTSLFFTLILNRNPHRDKKTIQRNIEPSCALHIEEIL